MERICRETVEAAILSVLDKHIPQDIDQIYEETLSLIMKSGKSACAIATKVLSWVLYMREPLNSRALLAALSVGENLEYDLNQVMATCANLVVLDTKCNVVRFAHQSVQDVLRKHVMFTAPKTYFYLASCCLDVCSVGPALCSASGTGFEIPSDDFYVYAAMYWPVHTDLARKLDDNITSWEVLTHKVTSFIFDEDWESTLSFDSWVENAQCLVSLLPRNHVVKPDLDAASNANPGPLYILSMFGLDEILDLALTNNKALDVNQQNKLGHTPVYLAAALGRSSTVKLLVEHGANINTVGGRLGSPLHAASFSGQSAVVESLLQLGADANCGSVFKNALKAAFRGGQQDVALLLVEREFAIETEEAYHEALGDAALMGFVEVVQTL